MDFADQIAAGRDAWARIQNCARKTFDDWLLVGHALVIGRSACMQAAGTNKPVGTRYNRLMGEWLAANGLDDVSAQERYRILLVLENLPAIEKWRAGLNEEKCRRFNHPGAIWQAWTLATKQSRHESAPPGDAPRTLPSRRASQDLIRETWMAMQRSGSRDLIILASIAVDCVLDYQQRAFAA